MKVIVNANDFPMTKVEFLSLLSGFSDDDVVCVIFSLSGKDEVLDNG